MFTVVPSKIAWNCVSCNTGFVQVIYNYHAICLWLTIHFSHCFHEVVWIAKACEAVTFRFLCFLVSHDPRFHERRVATERAHQRFVGHFVAEITTEHAEVIWKFYAQCLLLLQKKRGKWPPCTSEVECRPLLNCIIWTRAVDNALTLFRVRPIKTVGAIFGNANLRNL